MQPAKWLPPWWYVLQGAFLIVGIILTCTNPQFPPVFASFSSLIRPDAWAVFLGILLVSIALSDFLIFLAIRGIDRLFDLVGEATMPDLWPSTLVGVTEGILYPVAIAVGKADFIGIWLAVKVAGQWVRWGTEYPPTSGNTAKDQDLATEAKKGRRRFNKFLIGSGLRILFAALTFVFWRAFAFHSTP